MGRYVDYMFQENTDCLSLALRTARREYVLLVTILPIVFLVLEIVHVSSIINENPIDLQVPRTVVASITSLAFFWLFLGGVQEYIAKGYRDTRSIWWIVIGLEEFILFALLAVFQYIEYDTKDVSTSFWFWAIIDVLFGILIWIILSAGKPKIPEQRWLWWVKTAQLIWISVWLGYRPSDTRFEGATFVTLMICLFLAYVYYSRSRSWGFAVTLVPGIFLIAFLFRTSINDVMAVEWIFLSTMVIALIMYIVIIMRLGFEEDGLPSI